MSLVIEMDATAESSQTTTSKHTAPSDEIIGKKFLSTRIKLPNGQHVRLPAGRFKYQTATVNGRIGTLLINVDTFATINKKLFVPTKMTVDRKKKNDEKNYGSSKFSSKELTILPRKKLKVRKTGKTMTSRLKTSAKIPSGCNLDSHGLTEEFINEEKHVIHVSRNENYDKESLTVDVCNAAVVDEGGDDVEKDILSPNTETEEVIERISVPKSLLEHDSENIASIQQPTPLGCFLNKNISYEISQSSNCVSSTDTAITKQTDKMVMNPGLSSNVDSEICVYSPLDYMTNLAKQFSSIPSTSKTQEDFSQFIVSPPKDSSSSRCAANSETKTLPTVMQSHLKTAKITSPIIGGIEKVFIPRNMISKVDTFGKVVTTATMSSSSHTKPSPSKSLISSIPHEQSNPSPVLAKVITQANRATTTFYSSAPISPNSSTKLANVLYSNMSLQNIPQATSGYSLLNHRNTPISRLSKGSLPSVTEPSLPRTVVHTSTTYVLSTTNSVTKVSIVPTKEVKSQDSSKKSDTFPHTEDDSKTPTSTVTPVLTTVDPTILGSSKQYIMVNIAENPTEPHGDQTYKRIIVPLSSFRILPKDGGNTIPTMVQEVRQPMKKQPTGLQNMKVLQQPSPYLSRPPKATTYKPAQPFKHTTSVSENALLPRVQATHTTSVPEKYSLLPRVPVTRVPSISKQDSIISTPSTCVSQPESTMPLQRITSTTSKIVPKSPTIHPITDTISDVQSSSVNILLNQLSHQSSPTISGNMGTRVFPTSSVAVTSSMKPATSKPATSSMSTQNNVSMVNIPQMRFVDSPGESSLNSIGYEITHSPNIHTNIYDDLYLNLAHNRSQSEHNPKSTLSRNGDEAPMLPRMEPELEALDENQDAYMPSLEHVESRNTVDHVEKRICTDKTGSSLVESATETDVDPYSALHWRIYENKHKTANRQENRNCPSVKDDCSLNSSSDISDLGIKIESVYTLQKPESTYTTQHKALKRPRWVGSKSKAAIDESKLMKHPYALPVPPQCCNKKTNAFVVLERSNLFSKDVDVRKIRKLTNHSACDLICRTAALSLLCHNGLLKPHKFGAPDSMSDIGQVASCSTDTNISHTKGNISNKKRRINDEIEGRTTETAPKRESLENPLPRDKNGRFLKKDEPENKPKERRLSKKGVPEHKRTERRLYNKFARLPQEDKQFFTMTSKDKNLLIPIKQNIFYPRSYIYGDGDICFDMIPKNRLYALLGFHSKVMKTEVDQKIFKLSSSSLRRMFASEIMLDDTGTVIRCHEINAKYDKHAGANIDLAQTCISSTNTSGEWTEETTNSDCVLQESSKLSTVSYIDSLISENSEKIGGLISAMETGKICDSISATETSKIGDSISTMETPTFESLAYLTLQANENLLDQRTIMFEASEAVRSMNAIESEPTMLATNETSLDVTSNSPHVTSNSPEYTTDHGGPSKSQVYMHTDEMVSLLSNTPEPAEDVDSLKNIIKQQETELRKLKKWMKTNAVNLNEMPD